MIGKMARDVALLAQNSISEVREPAMDGRGGSSAMPHKRNPAGCQLALSAAIRAPGLVASILSGLPQELERGLGGWQAEGPVLAELFMLAAGSAEAMASAAEGLETDVDAMARNLAEAGVGEDAGEAAAIVAAILEDFREEG
jgi:3-carboxy-cis,cis-muconate cycloisomerase